MHIDRGLRFIAQTTSCRHTEIKCTHFGVRQVFLLMSPLY